MIDDPSFSRPARWIAWVILVVIALGYIGFIANAGREPAARAMATKTRLVKAGNPRRAGRVAEWPWGRFAVVTRSSRIKTSGDYARENRARGSNFVRRT